MSFSQTELLFPTHAVPDAGPLPPSAERLQIDLPDGETLVGAHFRPTVSDPRGRTLILAFGGNAWNAEHAGAFLHQLVPAADVVAFHYRGYRPSTGRPSAEALMRDASAVHDRAVERVSPDRTFAVGFSIGSGVAASLSRDRTLDGAVLVTPFDSLKAVAQSLFPWLPIGPFFQHDMDTAAYLQESKVPVAILAAERDEIVVPGRTAALRSAIGKPVVDRVIEGAGHNDIYERSDFQSALREAIAALGRQDQ